MSFRAIRGVPTILVGMLLVAVLFTAYTAQRSLAQQPADKIAVSGSDIDEVGDGTVIISETMRVSSPSDLILSVTAECSILTELTTGGSQDAGATDSATSFGSVRLQVLVDGTPVPVASDESDASEDDQADDDDSVGEVTFCNRTYHRDVSDEESPQDGLDEEHDFIRTRTANAFNWIALNSGTAYDEGGDNVLTIEVLADFDTTTEGDALADAFVGSRTLVVEPGHFAVNETVDPAETGGPGNGN